MPDRPPMWAPWRMAYIQGEKPKGCIFCEYPDAGPSLETLVVHVEPHAFVVLNRYPYINGHLMVVPRPHVSFLADLDDEVHRATADLLKFTSGVLREAFRPEGINIGMNLGRPAGAGIDAHIHYHLVPRWVGDTNFMSVVGDVRVISQSLEEVFHLLLPYYARR